MGCSWSHYRDASGTLKVIKAIIGQAVLGQTCFYAGLSAAAGLLCRLPTCNALPICWLTCVLTWNTVAAPDWRVYTLCYRSSYILYSASRNRAERTAGRFLEKLDPHLTLGHFRKLHFPCYTLSQHRSIEGNFSLASCRNPALL